MNFKQLNIKKEYQIISISLLVFLIFPWMSRHVDVTSAPVDPGILSIVIIAIVSFLIFKTATWWVIRAVWPILAEYSETDFEANFLGLAPWQKVLIWLGFYLLILFGFVLTLAALA